MTFRSDPPEGYSFSKGVHVHRMKGERLPSVTEIIGGFGLGFDYSGIPQHIVEAAGLRGSAFHRAVRLGLEDDLDWSTVDKKIEANVDATLEWLAQAKAVPWQLEVPVVSMAHRYAGIPDFWGLLYDHPTIVDYKSGETKGTDLQTSGYATAKVEGLLREYHQKDFPKEVLRPKRFCLAASGGKVKPTEYTDPVNEADFLACTRVWHLQETRR